MHPSGGDRDVLGPGVNYRRYAIENTLLQRWGARHFQGALRAQLIDIIRANAASDPRIRSLRPDIINVQHAGRYSVRFESEQKEAVLSPGADIPVRIEMAFENMFDRMLDFIRTNEGLVDTDRMSLTFYSPSLDNPVDTQFRPQWNYSGHSILQLFATLLQSAVEIDPNELRVVIVWDHAPVAGAEGNFETFEQYQKDHKRFIVKIDGVDDTCFEQCLALGLSEWSMLHKFIFCRKDFKYLKRTSQASNVRVLQQYARQMKAKLALPPGKTRLNSEMLTRVEDQLGLGIFVVQWPSRRSLYTPQKRFQESYCTVLYSTVDEHCYYVMNGHENILYGRDRFCTICWSGYTERNRHPCIPKCDGCGRREGCEGVRHGISSWKMRCGKCGFLVYDNACLEHHKCSYQYKCCPECTVLYNKKERHECGKTTCRYCHQLVDYNHKCYIQVLDPEKMPEPHLNKYCWDIETDVVELGLLQPNLVCLQSMETGEKSHYPTIDAFAREIFFTGKYTGATFIAHNGGKFDIHPLIEWLILNCDLFNQNKFQWTQIGPGNVVFGLKIKDGKKTYRFIDSYRFLNFGLANFSKAFGFDESGDKGHFPHELCTVSPELKRMGVVPVHLLTEEHFGAQRMKEKSYREFLEWFHELQAQGGVYDLVERNLNYCTQDVAVHTMGCRALYDIVMELSDGKIDVWNYHTIAGVTVAFFKLFDLKPDTIAILAESRDNEEELAEAEAWYAFLQRQIGCEFLQRADGCMEDPENGVVYEFLDCYDHGCYKCFRGRARHRSHQVKGVSLQVCYSHWKEKRKRIRQSGVEYRCSWMCQERGTQFRRFKKTFQPSAPPFKFEYAFHGGRTENFMITARAKQGEKGHYFDITSLYPCVMMGKQRGITPETYHEYVETPFPVGHPTIIRDVDMETFDVNDYYGGIQCDIQCPANLKHPFIPTKMKRSGDQANKLYFDLGDVHRNSMKRVNLETASAQYMIHLGYKITKVHEIHHFEEKSNVLFQSYVRRFYALKLIAKGWNDIDKETKGYVYKGNVLDVKTPEGKLLFKHMIYECEGIDLDLDKIKDEKNAGMYTVTKLFCNSFWGKLAEKNNYVETVRTTSEDEYWEKRLDPEVDVMYMIPHTPTVRTLKVKKKKYFRRNASMTNIAIAAFVTAYARIRTYKAIEVVANDADSRAAYTDTDSLIFFTKSNKELFKLGPLLGDFTSELDPDDHITRFVGVAPKFYSYDTVKGKGDTKLKGFGLNRQTASVVTLNSMEQLVYDTFDEERKDVPKLPVSQMQFVVHPKTHRLYKKIKDKDARFPSQKRSICEPVDGEIDTLPFGYKECGRKRNAMGSL